MPTCAMTKNKMVKKGKVSKMEAVRICGREAQDGSAYCPRCTFLTNNAAQEIAKKETAKLLAEEYGVAAGDIPKTRAFLDKAGFKYQGEGHCRACHRAVEFWTSPKQRVTPFKPMPVSLAEVEPHFFTCPEVMEYRRTA